MAGAAVRRLLGSWLRPSVSLPEDQADEDEAEPVLMLDGVDPLGQYRPYCDLCGDALTNSALRLEQARLLAEGHARRTRHDVRIEPWDSFALIELVTASELGGPFAGQPPTPPDRPRHSRSEDPRWSYRAGCSCRFCTAARQAGS